MAFGPGALGLLRLARPTNCLGVKPLSAVCQTACTPQVAAAGLRIATRWVKKNLQKRMREDDMFEDDPVDTTVPARFMPDISETGEPIERKELEPFAYEMLDQGWPIKSVILWDLAMKKPKTVTERDSIVKHWESWRPEMEQRRQAYMDGMRQRDKAFRDGLSPEERDYVEGRTAPLNQESMMGFSRITEISDDVAFRMFGHNQWISNISFAHLTRGRIKEAASQRMPLLVPFAPPSSKDIIRFSWKNVLSPDSNPDDPVIKKVKLKVFVDELQLPAKARETLIALVGDRYNERMGELKLVSRLYPTRQQNKEYLMDLLRALVTESLKLETQELAMREKAIREASTP